MQKVVFDEPYEFIPPFRSRIWSWAVGLILPRLIRSRYGVSSWKTHGLDHLRSSLKAGHGIILCPNHSRAADPMISGCMVIEANQCFYAMASWHVFKQSRLETFVCRGVGAFSVYREGLDRKALELATNIVTNAERPLVIFPEGVISAANDRLMPLMDGTAFVARAAAKRRMKLDPNAKVVIHPVAYKYQHQHDPDVILPPVLSRLERRFFWQSNHHLSVTERVLKLREAVQCAREVQVTGAARQGCVEARSALLANEILQKRERQWIGRARTGDVISRVKDLRIAIIPDMTDPKMDANERARRWRHLTELYYAQSMSLHIPGYLDRDIAGDRYNHHLIETLERLEEELTDAFTIHGNLHVDIHVGEPIEVDPSVRRSKDGDPVMATLRTQMLDLLQIEDRWPPDPVIDCDIAS